MFHSGKVLAALVHLLTACGVLAALLALEAVYAGDGPAALLWLLLALVIDGVDGPLARKLDVSHRLPQINGEVLDLIIDFLTYVLVPVCYIRAFGLLPAGLDWPLVIAILFSSLWLFVRRDMKASDNYFNGFPAVWNLVVIFWVILGTPLWFNALSTAVCVALTFAPVKSIHPGRVRLLYPLHVSLAVLWVVLSAILIRTPGPDGTALTGLWLAVTGWFPGFSLWRSLQRKSPA